MFMQNNNNNTKHEVGFKDDAGKTRFELLLPEFEEQVAEILTFGAEKYTQDGWRKVDNPVERYYGSLRRHINAWRSGEKDDIETGKSHLAHAACNLMFLMYFDEEHDSGVQV